MGLATRVIPTVLSKNGAMVKGKSFASDRVVGRALQASRIYSARGVDELIFLDIAATPEGRGPDFKVIEQLTAECFMPVTVGGGVRSVEDVRGLLNAGADKVGVCTGGPQLIGECAAYFGSQAIVAALDVRDGYAVTRCGTHTTMKSAVDWAKLCEKHGAGEILLTSIDRDGTMEGFDAELIRTVSQAVGIPVIASGGCGTPHHALEAICAGASAVAVGAMFQFTDETPRSVATYLQKNGVEVRLNETLPEGSCPTSVAKFREEAKRICRGGRLD